MAADAVYVRPPMYPMQERALFTGARYALIEASSKSGKTVGAMAWLLEQALVHRGGPGRNFWWIAPVYAQARIPFRRLKRGLPPQAYAANDSELSLTFPNGATMSFKGGDHADSLYGDDVWGAVVDEASRVKEESWHALRSTLTATRGPVRLIGNVKGRRNWFYALCRRAQAGEPDMAYAKITAHDAVAAGVLAAAEVDDARRTLPEAVFKELYLAEPSDDQGNPFGYEAIRRCIGPLSTGGAVAFGVDLAKSVDHSVIVGLDAHSRVCRFERFQAPWEETTGRVLRTLGRAPALVDSTGVGDPIVERLQRSGANVEGYHFTTVSKQQLVENLAVAIQQGEVTFPEGPIAGELEAFEYTYTRVGGVRYAAAEGMHDDAVCLPSGTLIRTAEGALPVELVRRGTSVLTHRGRYQPVLAVGARPARVLQTFTATGFPDLSATADHPLLVAARSYDSAGRTNTLRYAPPVWRSWDQGWRAQDYGLVAVAPTETVDVDVIDLLAAAPDTYADADGWLTARTYGGRRLNPKANRLRRFLEVDDDFCRFLGYFAAEGSVGRHNVGFASHSREAPLRDWLADYLARLGLRPSVLHTSPFGWVVSAGCVPLNRLLAASGNRAHKRLFAWTERLPAAKQWALLGGYLLGDATFTGGVCRVVTISPTLAFQVREIGDRLGVAPSVRTRRPRGTHRPQWYLSWGAPAAAEIKRHLPPALLAGKLVGARPFHHDQTQLKRAGPYTAGGLRRVVETVYDAGVTVYNLSVAEDESFVANGVVVHNCALALAVHCRGQSGTTRFY